MVRVFLSQPGLRSRRRKRTSMSKQDPLVMIIACDSFLAGIYGRKLEQEGIEVDVNETLEEAQKKVAKIHPDVVILDAQCTVDPIAALESMKRIPSLLNLKTVILAHSAQKKFIDQALRHGVDHFLLLGHFLPQEFVQKIKRLLQ